MSEVANRRVAQVEPRPEGPDRPSARVLDYLDRDLIILLGDPGAGKSHCFEQMAAAEHAPMHSVQLFVARDGDVQAKTVYLDGLDEYRPRTNARDSNPAVELLRILRRAGSPRLRISCRFADWLGSTDLRLFEDYCGTGAHAVLALQPLDQREASEILADRGVSKPGIFLAEATARHMEWMASNPQNLIMLADVVAHTGWPATKRDLYEQSSLRHLEEHNEGLRYSRLGLHEAADLMDPAGAACAALLISGVTAIRRGPSSDDQLPACRSVPCSNQEGVLAAMGRRAFVSAEPLGQDAASYVHRTIAEYLGARWLGSKVAGGLPLSRIQALLGVDSRPSPSLRGLHAWLPVFVPQHATALIAADPLGVLTYGDPASLSPSQKTDLVRALGALAAENPWFLGERPSDYGLAGLSCPDTAEHLVAILRSPASPISLKTLALRAISAGEPLAHYRPQLEQILADPAAPTSQRGFAFKSLLKYGPDGTEAVVRIYREVLAGDSASVGLRSVIVGGLYGRPFGAGDAVAILGDATAESQSQVTGELWPLVHGIPSHGLLDVLEEYARLSETLGGPSERRAGLEVSLSVGRMVGRLYESIPENDAHTVDRLLKVLMRIYKEGRSAFHTSIRFDEILAERPGVSEMLVDSAVRHMDELGHPPSVSFILNQLTGGAVTTRAVAVRLCTEFDGKDDGAPFTPSMLQRYEALGRTLSSCGAEAASLFERFMEIGRSRPECKALLEAYTRCEIDERRLQPSPFELGVAEYHAKLRQAVEREALLLQRGESLGLQGELAKLYFGLYGGESQYTTRKQLILAVGDSGSEAVERGFVAMVAEQPPPRLSEIAEANATNQFYLHWYAFLAGMDLLWNERRDLGGLSSDTLSSAFALSLLLSTFDGDGKNPSPTVRGWPDRILCDSPDIAEEVYTVLMSERLHRLGRIDGLLRSLLGAVDAPWRSRLALRLLLDCEPKDINDLQDLCLMVAESDDGRRDLAVIAEERIFAPGANGQEEDLLWVVVGFALVGQQFEARLAAAAPSHPETLWIIRAITQSAPQPDSRSRLFDLGLNQMEFIVRAFGPVCPNTARPSSGWGDRSGFDASMYLGSLVTAISTRPESAAGECLARLLGCEDLASYHPWISSRLTEQREVNRRSRYERPSWKAVCAVLTNGPPANIEDLKALFMADLLDAAGDIRHSNTDKYRVYWGGDRYSLGTPRDEEFCRDRLVDYLRERLRPVGSLVEPEGHMAADKRADIVVLTPDGLKLPVEVKRDTHRDLWSAARNQLARLYARDPGSQGYGVYLVFYFGPDRGSGITPHPNGALLADSPEELKRALDASVPAEHRDRITCAVVDVSPPASARPKASKAKRAVKKRTTAGSAPKKGR
jgi:hypothetical protein